MRILIVFLLLLLGSCSSRIHLKSNFDKSQAERILHKGTNKILGSSIIRLANGGVVTCAGLPIKLIPVTDVSQEMTLALTGSRQGGARRNHAFNKIEFSPKIMEFNEYQKVSSCDALGNFQFMDVADGDYYVVSEISWQASVYVKEDWTMVKMVSVKEGKEERLALTP